MSKKLNLINIVTKETPTTFLETITKLMKEKSISSYLEAIQYYLDKNSDKLEYSDIKKLISKEFLEILEKEANTLNSLKKNKVDEKI